MNPYAVLNIDPTDDKMAIRRAYVRECKLHHPDTGGDAGHFRLIQKAYEGLINNEFQTELIETEVGLLLHEFLYGCDAVAVVKNGTYKGITFEFKVPPMSWPGQKLEFQDDGLTDATVRVKLVEIKTDEYTRLDSNIVIRCPINTLEAELGKEIEVTNFDKTKYQIRVSPETTADRLIYSFPGAGFYDKTTKQRGNLTVMVEVDKKRFIDV